MARLLVTGGAGYIGSHTAHHLMVHGHEVVVFDDLSSGWAEAVPGRLVQGDVRDRAHLVAVLEEGYDAVLHFAARIVVPESLSDPIGYYDVNVGGTTSLLACMALTGCPAVVFSSSCAVYGVPPRVPITTDAPFAPVTPYGATKAAIERLLVHARRAGAVRTAALRYFNAAGAWPDARLGEAHDPETHLIPIAMDCAETGRPLSVYGTDHPTRDGTCERDFVHVLDLAEAHRHALEHLLDGHPGSAWNLGTGHGATVHEVLDLMDEVTGQPVRRVEAPARPGDPPSLVADPTQAHQELGWSPRFTLRDVVEHAWMWHQHPRYGPRVNN